MTGVPVLLCLRRIVGYAAAVCPLAHAACEVRRDAGRSRVDGGRDRHRARSVDSEIGELVNAFDNGQRSP